MFLCELKDSKDLLNIYDSIFSYHGFGPTIKKEKVQSSKFRNIAQNCMGMIGLVLSRMRTIIVVSTVVIYSDSQVLDDLD